MLENVCVINEPIPDHIGFVVGDVEKTAEWLSAIWGIGPWQSMDFALPKEDLLVGEPFALKVKFTKLGPTILELIQPVKGQAIWSQALETKGEGIHHVAFNISNWDEAVPKLQERGAKMVAGALSPKRWCYMQITPGGVIFELSDNIGMNDFWNLDK